MAVCFAHLAFICRHLNEEFLKKHLVLHKQIHNFTLEFSPPIVTSVDCHVDVWMQRYKGGLTSQVASCILFPDRALQYANLGFWIWSWLKNLAPARRTNIKLFRTFWNAFRFC